MLSSASIDVRACAKSMFDRCLSELRKPKDPQYYLSHTQKYFFRHEGLRHLRVEQFNRYLAMAGETNGSAPMTLEDTISDGDDAPVDTSHRNFDQIMEDTSPGAHFNAALKDVPGF